MLDADLIAGSQVGGLVGQGVAGRGIAFTNCSTDQIIIRMSSVYSKNKSGFIGQLNDGGGVDIISCLVPASVTYLSSSTGSPVDYTPNNDYYGVVGKNGSSIVWG